MTWSSSWFLAAVFGIATQEEVNHVIYCFKFSSLRKDISSSLLAMRRVLFDSSLDILGSFSCRRSSNVLERCSLIEELRAFARVTLRFLTSSLFTIAFTGVFTGVFAGLFTREEVCTRLFTGLFTGEEAWWSAWCPFTPWEAWGSAWCQFTPGMFGESMLDHLSLNLTNYKVFAVHCLNFGWLGKGFTDCDGNLVLIDIHW